MMTAICGAFYLIYFDDQNVVNRKIESMARDYYTDYYYANMLENSLNVAAKDILSKYADTGLPIVPLRQLLLYDNGRNADEREYLEKFCDTNETYIRIFPKSPYDKHAYHFDVKLSCNFE